MMSQTSNSHSNSNSITLPNLIRKLTELENKYLSTPNNHDDPNLIVVKQINDLKQAIQDMATEKEDSKSRSRSSFELDNIECDQYYQYHKYLANDVMFCHKLATIKDRDCEKGLNQNLRDLRKILVTGSIWNGLPETMKMEADRYIGKFLYDRLNVCLFLRHLMWKCYHKIQEHLISKKCYDFEINIDIKSEMPKRFGTGSPANHKYDFLPRETENIGCKTTSLLEGFRLFNNSYGPDYRTLERHLNLIPGTKNRTAIMNLFIIWFEEMFSHCSAKFEKRNNLNSFNNSNDNNRLFLTITSIHGRLKRENNLDQDLKFFRLVKNEWDEQYEKNKIRDKRNQRNRNDQYDREYCQYRD